MSNRIFFIVMTLSVVVIIGLAFLPLRKKPLLYHFSDQKDARSGFSLTEQDLFLLKASPYTEIEIKKTDEGVPYAVLTAEKKWQEAPSKGIYLTLPDLLKRAYAGRHIRLTLSAKTQGDEPVEFGLGYFASAGGESGFRRFTAQNRLKDYNFIWRIPAKTHQFNHDMIEIWPDLSGQNKSLEVYALTLKVLN